MTILDKFVHFAKGLPSERLHSVEAALAEIMESYSGRYDFTVGELAELDKRVAEERPTYAHPDDIAKLLGKKFSE